MKLSELHQISIDWLKNNKLQIENNTISMKRAHYGNSILCMNISMTKQQQQQMNKYIFFCKDLK